jgi:hypothetical protein
VAQRSIQFRLSERVAREHIERVVQLAVQKIAMQCLTGIVLRTPVDTGRARSNWHVSIEAPVLDQREPYSPGAGLGAGERANAQAAISAGTAVIGRAPAFGMIFISNGLPYINRLEHGWSGQAPAGMVRVTLDQVAAQFA